ncbi:MAG TPA: Nramp family divalent metal transporter [Chitinophagaceae bacterium]|nr:Nramp family divalent metal transporter [Chitinophagaceae bacterium]
MTTKADSHVSLSEVHESIDTNRGSKGKKILAFLGPAYLVSVGYMDPGNWATDLAGGSQFGYSLIWVLLMSNLMALLLQNLSARLGIVRGRDLAQVNREVYPPAVNFILYLLAETAIAACDLAEVLGMAIGIHLLTGIPILWGVCITVLDTFLLFYLQRLGMRKMEAFIVTLVGIIGLSFLAEMFFAKPKLSEVITGFIPGIPGKEALYIAIGIIGATVMPHNLYLHSALVQTRKIGRDEPSIRRALRLNMFDTTIALNLAFFVNAAILVLAAAVFFKAGRTDVAEIKDAHQLLAPMLGSTVAPVLFAIALIAAGQSSTITGTLAGQIVMEGYLLLRINPLLRRLITRLLAIIPAVLTIVIWGDNKIDALLIFSQVILSLQLGFAIIPLIHFVSEKDKMGVFAIKPLTQVLSWLVAAVLVYLNLRMVFGEGIDFLHNDHSLIAKTLVVAGLALLVILLVIVISIPLMKKIKQEAVGVTVHNKIKTFNQFQIPQFKHIAVALDFSGHDERLVSFALGQGGADTRYILVHVVESASAHLLGDATADLESSKDKEQLASYAQQLLKRGNHAVARLGYRHRVTEIVRIVKEEKADLLVMGAHGHTAIKDLVYGETINKVRHELKIPVLVVNLL